jgi:hypothetical protein
VKNIPRIVVDGSSVSDDWIEHNLQHVGGFFQGKVDLTSFFFFHRSDHL